MSSTNLQPPITIKRRRATGPLVDRVCVRDSTDSTQLYYILRPLRNTHYTSTVRYVCTLTHRPDCTVCGYATDPRNTAPGRCILHSNYLFSLHREHVQPCHWLTRATERTCAPPAIPGGVSICKESDYEGTDYSHMTVPALRRDAHHSSLFPLSVRRMN